MSAEIDNQSKKRLSISKLGVFSLTSLVICFLVTLVVFLIFLAAINQTAEQFRVVLTTALDSEINTLSNSTGFSGSLHNISDELINNPILAELGKEDSFENESLVAEAQLLLDDVVERTKAAPGKRMFYFAKSNSLLCASKNTDKRMDSNNLPLPVKELLADLHSDPTRFTGSFENHIGVIDNTDYQLIVRTLCPNVYYLVYSTDMMLEIPESFSQLNDVQLYTYDQFGMQVSNSKPTALTQAFTYDTLGEEDTGVVHITLDGKDYMGVYCTSHTRNIRVAIFFEDQIASAKTLSEQLFIIATLVIFACFMALIIGLFKAYRPIGSLAKKLQSNPNHSSKASAGNTSSHKQKVLRNDSEIITEALKTYNTIITDQEDMLTNQWLTRALHGNHPEVLSGYECAWAGELEDHPYVVTILRSDFIGLKDDNFAADTLPSLEENLQKEFLCHTTSLTEGLVAIIPLEHHTIPEVTQYLKILQDEQENSNWSAFTGTPHKGLDELSIAFEEANDASQYYLAQESYGINIRYEEVADKLLPPTSDAESLLLLPKIEEQILQGDKEGALKAFDAASCAMKNEDERLGISRESSHVAVLRSVSEGSIIALSAKCKNPNEKSALLENATLFAKCNDLKSIRKQLCGVFRILDSQQEHATPQEQFDRIKAYVKTNYHDPNLSAGAIARDMGISQSWITRLFKRFSGTTFLEYVHSLRLDEAQRLLTSTTLTEGEIASHVGYNNVITMIRAFKKYRGITPSSLR